MTPDERDMLSDLAGKIAQTPAPPRDAEAEEFIRTNIGRRPDALYLMTQTVLIQNMALQHAQDQIRELQQQPGRGSAGGSFLGQQPSGYSQPNAGPQYSAPPPQYGAPGAQYGAPAAGSGGPGFLRGAAQTAAGVAAGALAFEGIRSLFSHPGFSGSGFGGGLGSGMAPEVINNYYDSPEHGRNEHLADGRAGDATDSRDAAINNADDYTDDQHDLVDNSQDDSIPDDDSDSYTDSGDSDDSGSDFS